MIPQRIIKHPRPVSKNETKGGKWRERSVATERLKSDSAIVTHPLLFCKRTHVRSILSALQFRCSLLILLDNSLPPPLLERLFFPFLHPSSAPPLPTQQTDSRALRYNVDKQGRKRKSEETPAMRRHRKVPEKSTGQKARSTYLL